MNHHGLAPQELKRHVTRDVIAESKTFETHGVTTQTAKNYLGTPEGSEFLRQLIDADATSPLYKIRERAIEQLTSGRDLPRMVTITPEDALVKAVPRGEMPTPYTPFFGLRSEFEKFLAAGHAINDSFGLPLKSEAPVYDLAAIRPLAPTQVFVSTVARTSELGGQVTHTGGAEQYLVPNRKLFSAPERVTSIGNDLALHDELVVARGLGTPIAETAPRSLAPELARGAGVLGVAVVAIDATTTASHASDLLHQGNTTGAASTIEHFGSRNLGMFGGAALGAEVLGAAGVETGPGDLVLAGVGGIGGAVAGDKLASWYDERKICNQTDAQSLTWHLDRAHPQQGWTREVMGTPASYGADPVHIETAPPALAARLTFQANNTAVELALAHPAAPRDPYTQSANEHDTESSGNPPWRRDARSGQWSREIAYPFVERQPMRASTMEVASSARAAELDQAAQATLVANFSQSARGIAMHYQKLYAERDWQAYGAMPAAVSHALAKPTNVLEASDGHTYTRGRDGQWTTPGRVWGRNPADANVRSELDASERLRVEMSAPATTQAARTPALPEHLRDFRHPGHPLHADYTTLLQHVHVLEDGGRMAHGAHSERAAATLLNLQQQHQLGSVQRVEMHVTGKGKHAPLSMHLVTHESDHKSYVPVERATPISVFDVTARSVEQASHDWARHELPHLFDPHAQAMRETPSNVTRHPANFEHHDPRRIDHPQHARFEGLRTRIGALYAQYGIGRNDDQLDRATAAVMRDLQTQRPGLRGDELHLARDPATGRIGPHSGILVTHTHGFAALPLHTPAAAMQQPAAQAFQQLDQVTQQQTRQAQRDAAQVRTPSPPGFTL